VFDLHRSGTVQRLRPPCKRQARAPNDKLALIVNFFDELRRIASATKRRRPFPEWSSVVID
jgi:hypothetical protein